MLEFVCLFVCLLFVCLTHTYSSSFLFRSPSLVCCLSVCLTLTNADTRIFVLFPVSCLLSVCLSYTRIQYFIPFRSPSLLYLSFISVVVSHLSPVNASCPHLLLISLLLPLPTSAFPTHLFYLHLSPLAPLPNLLLPVINLYRPFLTVALPCSLSFLLTCCFTFPIRPHTCYSPSLPAHTPVSLLPF